MSCVLTISMSNLPLPPVTLPYKLVQDSLFLPPYSMPITIAITLSNALSQYNYRFKRHRNPNLKNNPLIVCHFPASQPTNNTELAHNGQNFQGPRVGSSRLIAVHSPGVDSSPHWTGKPEGPKDNTLEYADRYAPLRVCPCDVGEEFNIKAASRGKSDADRQTGFLFDGRGNLKECRPSGERTRENDRRRKIGGRMYAKCIWSFEKRVEYANPAFGQTRSYLYATRDMLMGS